MVKWFNKFINTGVKSGYQPWEIYITRKLNLITSITFCNMVIALVFLKWIEYTDVLIDCVLSVSVLPFIILLNNRKNYVWALYGYYIIGFGLLASISLKMGIDSYIILFYFPMMISLIQIMGRRETLKHLIVISLFCFLTIIVVVIGYQGNLFEFENHFLLSRNVKLFNIVLCFFSALAFNISIVYESIGQEHLINKMLREKEVLLAEVFHRVKNNMNIVTSLLNLKKEISESQEVKDALEDCRNRVFSMALVHQTIFNNNNIVELNFKTYTQNLTAEIKNSLGSNRLVDIHLATDEVMLDLSSAIPCGLILNELITNSFKYAVDGDKTLRIEIKMRHHNDVVELEVRDNGKGLMENSLQNQYSLGMELINSLTEQIDGTHKFTNDNGLVFNLSFRLKN